jgi:gentisate 1,2-dioxygenase
MEKKPVSGTELEDLELFYEEVRRAQSRPLWVARSEPPAKAIPYLWKYADFRPLLLRAAKLVPMEQAERRVLIFANPGLQGRGPATSTLSANLQIINPGEIAPSHRHTASALRLIVEGSDAYTAVEGEKTYMEPGDFITTPNWTWHDHGNEGDAPMVWLDGLDSQLVNTLDAAFREEYPDEKQPLTKAVDLSQRLYGAGSLTPTWERHNGLHSPLINYKFAQTYGALSTLAKETEGSPFDGVCLEYTNPTTGGPAMATIACFAQILPKGAHTQAHRHTGGTVYHVISGKGQSVIDGVRFDWSEKDTFVVPAWSIHEHIADTESVLFSYNDSPVLEPMGLYREEAYTDNGGHQKVTGTFEPITS